MKDEYAAEREDLQGRYCDLQKALLATYQPLLDHVKDQPERHARLVRACQLALAEATKCIVAQLAKIPPAPLPMPPSWKSAA